MALSLAPAQAQPGLKCDMTRCEGFLTIFFLELKEMCLDEKGREIRSEQCREKFLSRNGLWKKECEDCNFQELYKKVRPHGETPPNVEQ